MHEMSVALEICRLVEAQVAPEMLGGVVTVAVDVGDECGLEAANLEFCLEALLSQPPFVRAQPILMRQPGDVLRLNYLEVDDGRPDD